MVWDAGRNRWCTRNHLGNLFLQGYVGRPGVQRMGDTRNGLATRTNRWLDNISGARRAASGLKEYLRPLNKQLTERVHELISLSDGAREFHAGVLEKGGSLRYFHLQAMHAMTGTPTIEEEVDEMFEGPFAAVQQLLSVGLMLALFTATVWYSMFAGRH
jgi:hypothetical protein